MQVQNITNSQIKSQNFNGKIDIIPGDLSYKPAKYVRKAYGALNDMIKDKPFNLYIRQDYQNNIIKITAQTEDNFIKQKGLKAEGYLSTSADVYEAVASTVVSSYEAKAKNQPEPFIQKIKKCAAKIYNNFFKTK